MPRGFRALGLLAALALAGPLAASERGQPLVEVYDAQELGGGHINEALVELGDGRIAVGNVGGVLLFDGARWRMFNHPERLGGVQQLAVAPDGKLYTAFNGDIGYFRDDGTGALHWHSQGARVAEADRGFSASVAVHYDAHRQGVWFLTLNRLYFVPDDGSPAQAHAAEGVHAFGGLVGQDYWVQSTLGGLQKVAQLSPLALAPLPGRDALGAGQYLREVVPDGGEWKVAMANGRLYRYREGAFLPWAEALWPMLASSQVYALMRLRDGRFVIGAGEHGPLLLDAEGRLLDRYTREDGVPARPTKGLLEDRMGGLWLAQETNLVRIDLARGISLYDESRGLPQAYALTRWRGVVHVASGRGLYRLNAGGDSGGARFERVLPVLRNTNALAAVDGDTLLVASGAVFAITEDATGQLHARTLVEAPRTSNLVASRFVPGRAWALLANSVARIDRTGRDEFAVTPLPDFDTPVQYVAEEDADTVWFADRAGGVWRMHVDGATPPLQLRPEDGVPEGTIRIYPRQGEGVWFTTTAGLRVFDEATSRLVAPSGLPAELFDRRLFSLYEDFEGNLWVRGDDLTDVALRGTDGYRWDQHSLRAVSDMPTVFGFAREGDVAWVLRADGVVRIDLAARQDLPPPLAPLLVAADDTGARQPLALGELSTLPTTVRNLSLNFALPAVFRAADSRYRSRLSSVDREWTDWTADATRNYTNLPDGESGFALEARDAFGRVSAMAPMTIAVAPPWFRTRWAKAGYLSSALLALWGASWIGGRRRNRAMQARQRELEALVAGRTQELQQSNAQLAEQAERLAEVDRLKTRFFVNVGHEFRTPLTLVLGPIEDLLRDTRERFSTRAREQLEMANRNARRVLDLIVELLDVNRYEYGRMRLHSATTDLRVLAQRVLAEQMPLLERHGHHGVLEEAGAGPWLADVDPVQLERALGNLIGNAAKYMARGGRVELALRRDDAEIEIAVTDHGAGISPQALPHVFDRFFQAEGSDRASGYGIGLSLVREIVEAHQGRVEVSSELGIGSTFRLILPALAADAAVAAEALVQAPLAATTNERVESGTATTGGRVDPKSATTGGRVDSDLAMTDERVEAEAVAPQRGRPLVLVVDDHDDLRARVRGLLEDRYVTIEAADGPGAWNLARDRLPDLIVCDVMMPGFDGTELTRRLRADPETAAIAMLLLTAKAGSEHAVTGLEAGADDYLAKPFDSSELLARIAALLARAQRLRLRQAREREAAPAPIVAESESVDQRWRRRIEELIARHLDDPELTVEQLADEMHADRSQLFRKCKELLGTSPSEYLRDTRLRRAHELLQSRAGSVSEIAYAVGFDSLSSFTRAFKARYTLPPSQVAARKAG